MRSVLTRLIAGAAVLGMAGVFLTAGWANATARPADAIAAFADPAPEEQEAMRQLAAAIWTPELAADWNMNSDVADVLSAATGAILRCSEAFDQVPRPPGFVPGLGYLVSNAVRLLNYFTALKANRAYRPCVVTTAASYRTRMELASMGV